MKTLQIYTKTKKNLIEELRKEFIIKEVRVSGWLSLFSKKPKNIDIYFYDNDIEVNQDLLEDAKLIITSSLRLKNQIIEKYPIVEKDNILVFYPFFYPQEIDSNEANLNLKKELNLKDEKIILFNASDFRKSGAKDFVSMVANLPSSNYVAIVAGTKKQLEALKFQIAKYVNLPNLFLVDDFENIDLLFAASDIFILPSSQKTFNANILKAMYYKCGVFVTNINDASEIVDVFATIQSPNDGSAPYKISALLTNDDDLIKIKEDNHNISKKFLLEKQMQTLKSLIASF